MAAVEILSELANAAEDIADGVDVGESGKDVLPHRVKRGITSKLKKLDQRKPGAHRFLTRFFTLVGRWLVLLDVITDCKFVWDLREGECKDEVPNWAAWALLGFIVLPYGFCAAALFPIIWTTFIKKQLKCLKSGLRKKDDGEGVTLDAAEQKALRWGKWLLAFYCFVFFTAMVYLTVGSDFHPMLKLLFSMGACMFFGLAVLVAIQGNLVTGVSVRLLYLFSYAAFGIPALCCLDVALATVYVFEDMERTKYLVYLERLRLLTESVLEAIPTAIGQLILVFRYRDCFPPEDIGWAVLSVVVSALSLGKNVWLLRKGASERNESVWEYLKIVLKAGMGGVPFIEGMRHNTLERANYIGFDLLNLEIQRVADAAVESDSIRTIQMVQREIDVRNIRGSPIVRLEGGAAARADLLLIAALLRENRHLGRLEVVEVVLLDGSEDGVAAVLRVFQETQHFRELEFRGIPATKIVPHLANNDDSYSALEGLRNVRRVSFVRRSIVTIAPNPLTSSFKSLTLLETAADDDIVEAFVESFGGDVAELDLRRNEIGGRGCAAIVSLINSSSCLKKLDLRENECLNEESASDEVTRLVHAAFESKTLRTLNGMSLAQCEPQTASEVWKPSSTIELAILTQQLSRGEKFKPQSIELTRAVLHSRVLSKKILSFALQEDVAIHFKIQRGSSSGRDKNIPVALLKRGDAMELDLEGVDLGVGGAYIVAALLTSPFFVTGINLVSTKLGDEEVTVIGEALEKNHTLEKLNMLVNDEIGFEGIKAIGASLQKNSVLKTLKLDKFEFDGDATELNFEGKGLSQHDGTIIARLLAKNSTLKTLKLDKFEFNYGHSSSTGSVDLSDKMLECTDAVIISGLLKNETTITELDLKNNMIGDNGFQSICKALETNSTLVSLDISGNNCISIEESKMPLSNLLHSNSTLKTLKMSFQDKRGNIIQVPQKLIHQHRRFAVQSALNFVTEYIQSTPELMTPTDEEEVDDDDLIQTQWSTALSIYRFRLFLITLAMGIHDFDDPILLGLVAMIGNALLIQSTLSSEGGVGGLTAFSQTAALVVFGAICYTMYRVNLTERYCKQCAELGEDLIENREEESLGPISTLTYELGGPPPPRQSRGANITANFVRARELGPAYEIAVLEPLCAAGKAAAGHTCTHSGFDIKDENHAREKAVTDYDGDGSRIVDLLRGTVVCEDMDDVLACIAQLKKLEAEGVLSIVRIENQFRDCRVAEDGYRYISISLDFKDHLCELQIQLQAFYDLKDQTHSIYNVARSLMVGKSLEIADTVQISWTYRTAVSLLMMASASVSAWQASILIFFMPGSSSSVLFLAMPWCLLSYVNVARMIRVVRSRDCCMAGALQLAFILTLVYIQFSNIHTYGADVSIPLTVIISLLLVLFFRDVFLTLQSFREKTAGIRRRSRIGLLYDRYLGLNGTHFVWGVITQQLGMITLQAWTKLPNVGKMVVCPFADTSTVRLLFYVVLATLGLNAIYPSLLLPLRSIRLRRDLLPFLDAFIDIIYGPLSVFVVVTYTTGIKFIADPTDLVNFVANFTPTLHLFTVACGIELSALQRSMLKYNTQMPQEDTYHHKRLEGQRTAQLRILATFTVAALLMCATAVAVGCYEVFPKFDVENSACAEFIWHGRTEIDLSTLGLDDVEAATVAKNLEANKQLLSLNLQNNTFGDAGAKALAESLKRNARLLTLDVSDNPIGPSGILALAEALKSNSVLRTLDISGIHLDRMSGEAIGVAVLTNIKGLTFLSCGVSTNPVTLFVGDIRTGTLRSLDLSSSGVNNDVAFILAGIIGVRFDSASMTALYLSGNKVGNSGTIALAEASRNNTALKVLDLSNNLISGGGIKAVLIWWCQRITCDLTNNRMCDATRDASSAINMEKLRETRNLTMAQDEKVEHIDLLWVDPRCIATGLKSYDLDTKLMILTTMVDLGGVGLTNDQITSFAALLINATNLKHIDLSKNFLGSSAMAVLTQVLKRNAGIQSLDIRGSRANVVNNDTVAIEMASAVLEHPSVIEFNGIKLLELSMVVRGELTNTTISGGCTIKPTECGSSFRVYDKNNDRSDHHEGCIDINGDDHDGPVCSTSSSWYASDATSDNRYLRPCPGSCSLSSFAWDLHSLNLGDVEALVLAGFLAQFGSLITLDVSNNNIGSVGLHALLKSVAGHESASLLTLSDNNFGNDFVFEVASYLYTEAAGFASNLSVRFFEDNAPLSSSTIDLSGAGLTNAEATRLAEMLTNATNLKHIDLSKNDLGSSAMAALTQVLNGNPGIQSLDIRGSRENVVKNDTVAIEMASAVLDLVEFSGFKLLELSKVVRGELTNTTISGCTIKPTECRSSFRVIDENNDRSDYEGCIDITGDDHDGPVCSTSSSWYASDATSDNRYLRPCPGSCSLSGTAWDLHSLNLGDVEALVLAGFLAQFGSLITLDVSNNNIGSVGLHALLKSVAGHESASLLTLSDNNFGNDFVLEVASYLYTEAAGFPSNLRVILFEDNAPLSSSTIDLSGIGLTNAEATRLAEILTKAANLKHIDLSKNFLGSIALAALAQVLKRNAGIQSLDIRGSRENVVKNDTVAIEMASAVLDLVEFSGFKLLELSKVVRGELTNTFISGCTIKPTECSSSFHVYEKNNDRSDHEGCIDITGDDYDGPVCSTEGVWYAFDATRYNQYLRPCRSSCSLSGTAWDLHSLNLGDVEALVLAGFLAQFGSLITLDVSNNNIGSVGLHALLKSVAEHESASLLTLSDNNFGNVFVFEVASYLYTEAAGFPSNLSVSLFEDNAPLSSSTIDLSGIGLTNAEATRLAEILTKAANLKHIDLSKNFLGSSALAALAQALKRNAGIQSLDIRGSRENVVKNDTVAIEMASAVLDLVEFNGIKLLELSEVVRGELTNTTISGGCTIKPTECRSSFLVVDENNDRSYHKGCIDITGDDHDGPVCSTSSSWWAEDATFDNRYLRPCPGSCSLSGTAWDLHSLNLGDVEALVLAGFLAQFGSLITLDVSNNNIGSVGLHAIVSAANTHPSLDSLDLSDSHGDQVLIKLLTSMLVKSTRLSHLILRNVTGLTGASMLDFVNMALRSPSLKTYSSISLQDHRVGELGTASIWDYSESKLGESEFALVALLATNSSTLESLDLSNSLIDDYSATLLAQMMGTSRSLTHLNLYHIVGQSDTNARILVDAALKSSTILSLNGVQIGDMKAALSDIKAPERTSNLTREGGYLLFSHAVNLMGGAENNLTSLFLKKMDSDFDDHVKNLSIAHSSTSSLYCYCKNGINKTFGKFSALGRDVYSWELSDVKGESCRNTCNKKGVECAHPFWPSPMTEEWFERNVPPKLSFLCNKYFSSSIPEVSPFFYQEDECSIEHDPAQHGDYCNTKHEVVRRFCPCTINLLNEKDCQLMCNA